MITVGLIGAGYIGPIHLGALVRLGGVRVKTVVDVNGKLAARAAATYNIEHSGTDHRDVINDPGIDVIHNCTPNKYHFDITREALKAGKQVLHRDVNRIAAAAGRIEGEGVPLYLAVFEVQ